MGGGGGESEVVHCFVDWDFDGGECKCARGRSDNVERRLGICIAISRGSNGEREIDLPCE